MMKGSDNQKVSSPSRLRGSDNPAFKDKVTWQRMWQTRQLVQGRCEFCSRPRVTKKHCEKCRQRVNRLRLAKYWRDKIAGKDVH